MNGRPRRNDQAKLTLCNIRLVKYMGIIPTGTSIATDLVLVVVKVKARELQNLKDLAK